MFTHEENEATWAFWLLSDLVLKDEWYIVITAYKFTISEIVMYVLSLHTESTGCNKTSWHELYSIGKYLKKLEHVFKGKGTVISLLIVQMAVSFIHELHSLADHGSIYSSAHFQVLYILYSN